ncbi:MAG: hypothetical protein ACFFDI_27815 [Promethearchaeota archaeon]
MFDSGKLDLIELAEGVVDYFWNAPLPEVEVYHSARKGASNNLIWSIASQVGNLTQEDAYKKIITLLEENKSFRASVEDIIKSSISDFENHYINYGGRSALFSYCLLLSLGTDKNSRLFKAKASLLNWYAEKRSLDRSLVDGGVVSAWWPFEWFSSNFDAIAASVIASGIFTTTGALISRVLKAFRISYEPVKKSCNPYPQPVLRSKSPDQTIEDFGNSLEDAGLIDRFLYLFKLNNNEINELIEDWTKAFIWFRKTLNSYELNLLIELLKGPVQWSKNRSEANELRKRHVVRLVEPSPLELWLAIYFTS